MKTTLKLIKSLMSEAAVRGYEMDKAMKVGSHLARKIKGSGVSIEHREDSSSRQHQSRFKVKGDGVNVLDQVEQHTKKAGYNNRNDDPRRAPSDSNPDPIQRAENIKAQVKARIDGAKEKRIFDHPDGRTLIVKSEIGHSKGSMRGHSYVYVDSIGKYVGKKK